MSETLSKDSALKKAMALCASREMCIYDIRQKLVSWGLNDDDIGKILNLLTEGKFLDEERYARAFSSDKFKYNKWGKVKIGNSLRMKRIEEEIIAGSLDSIDDAEYSDLLKSIIAKLQKTVRAKNQYDLKGKILRHCLSKGFESQLVYDILNEFE